MKKILIILFCFATTFCIAQNITKTKKKTRSYRRVKRTYNEVIDSAQVYYLRGWDAYKKNDLGAARYFWERGANCKTNIPSKYSSAFRLGLMHQNGEGIGVNYGNAFYYYNFAYCNGQSIGDSEATKIIAAYYENGIFVIQDYRKALEWYKKAKQQGNKYCDDDITRIKQKLAQNI